MAILDLQRKKTIFIILCSKFNIYNFLNIIFEDFYTNSLR